LDNLTHSLVGLTAAKAGLERLSPGATILCVLAANAPDADIVVLAFGDRWDFLQHHRGITHAIIGTAFLALLLPLIFFGVDRLWARLRHQSPKTKFRGLLIASVIASATHPFLDWTNNYGIRFLLPWNPRWFYGDLVFIVDPFIWVVLGGAAFLLASKTKVSKFIWLTIAAIITFLIVVGPRSGDLPGAISIVWITALFAIIILFSLGARERWGTKIAFVAIGIVLAYWGVLAFLHSRALTEGREAAYGIAVSNGETLGRIAAMPTLANPLRWDFVFDTDKATYRFPLVLNRQTPAQNLIRYPRPSGKLAATLDAAAREKPAHVFLGFARFPVAKLADPDCTTQTLLQLADLRYTEPGRSRGTFAVELPVDCPDEALTFGALGGR
jgi:inner membrane protein